MSKQRIEDILNSNNITEFWITVLGNNAYRLNIPGEVHVQQIKDLFNVSKWEYSGKNVIFYIQE